jgi:hypothetical protein
MQPMSMEPMALCTVRRILLAGVVVSLLACQSAASDAAADSTASAMTMDSSPTEMAMTVVPCGRAQQKRCKGELPDDWRTSIDGQEWSVKLDQWQHKLGFGRPQVRRAHNSSPARYSAFTTIYPLDDAHTVSPDKIGGPTVFAILYPSGPELEHKWQLDPSANSRYVAILDKSDDPHRGTWHLERVYWDKDASTWRHSPVAGTGRWRTCPQNHPPKDYAYADFLRCDQQQFLPPQVLSLDTGPSNPQSASRLLALPTMMNSISRNGEEPIWIFCPAGCCEAEW